MRPLFTTFVAAAVVATASVAAASLDDEGGVRSAKAAAHAALIDRADLPDHPPRLPDNLAEPPPRAVPGGRGHDDNRGQAIRKAKAEAQQQADDAAHAARADVANRAAAGSAAAAARNGNNADERAAAGQARARAAHANKPDKPGPPDNPGKGQGPKN
jgi:hypothetical protein